MAIDNKIVEDLIQMVKDRLNIGPQGIVGIDIGLSSVKVAEISHLKDGSKKLTKYATIPLPEATLIEDEIQKKDELLAAIEAAIKEAGIGPTNACIGLSGPNTIVRKLPLAGGDMDELEDQAMWEVEQYVPFPIDESAMGFSVIGENEGGGVDVVVAVAKNDVIDRFKDLVERAKVRVRIVDMNFTALANIAEMAIGPSKFNSKSSHLIIDVGAQKSEFLIVKNGGIVFTKEISSGGVMITEEIQRQMGVNYDDAEDLKRTGDEEGNLPEEILEIVDDVVENFLVEVKKTMDFYITATSDENLEAGYVTGGGALIPGILEGLEEVVGCEINVLNPFENLDYDDKRFDEDTINSALYFGAVSMGLALREIPK